MAYVKSLTFTLKPDYSYLKRLFRDAFTEKDFDYDYAFEWKLLKSYALNTKSASPTKAKEIADTEENGEETNSSRKKDDKEDKDDSSCSIF